MNGADKTRKPKIVVVGVGHAGYQVLDAIKQSNLAGDLSFLSIQSMPNKDMPDAHNIKLYRRSKWTLEELKSYFLEMELCLDGYYKFEEQLQDGDKFNILRTTHCCMCSHRDNIGVVIERDGKEVYRAYFDYTRFEAQEEEKRRLQDELLEKQKIEAIMLLEQKWQYKLAVGILCPFVKLGRLFFGKKSEG